MGWPRLARALRSTGVGWIVKCQSDDIQSQFLAPAAIERFAYVLSLVRQWCVFREKSPGHLKMMLFRSHPFLKNSALSAGVLNLVTSAAFSSAGTLM